jgi:hypothetical protein
MEPQTTAIFRDDLYREPRTRRLLASMTRPRGGLYPKRALEGDYRYYQAEEMLEATPSETLNLLNQLTEARILEREVFLTQLICPVCKSPQLMTTHRCPFCEGNELKKVILVEHLTCRYVNSKERFLIGGQLVCPMCQQPIESAEKLRREEGFECASCLKVTITPLLRQECATCGKAHSNESVELRPVYRFKVNEKTRDEVLEACRIDIALSKHLTAKGYTVTSPAVIRGSLGTYTVDILAKGKSETFVGNVLDLGREANVEDVLKFLVPVTDVRPTKSILASIPPLPEKVKRLARLYGLTFLEGNSMKDLLSEMERLL